MGKINSNFGQSNGRLGKIDKSVEDVMGIYHLSNHSTGGITRRDFIKLSLISLASALVSCGTPNLSPTSGAGEFTTYNASVPKDVYEGIALLKTPSTSAQDIGLLPPGMPLFLIGRTENEQWVEVQLSNGVTGWVVTTFLELDSGIDIEKLIISSRAAAAPLATLTPSANPNDLPNANPNDLVEDVSQEILEELVQAAIEDAVDKGIVVPANVPGPTVVSRPTVQPTRSTGGDTITLPCPAPIPPGYICTCNCV